MEPWIIQSNPKKSLATAVACLIVGAMILYLTQGVSFSAMSDRLAGWLLGMLLVVIAFGFLVTRLAQTVTVDPMKRTITVTDTTPWKSSERVIPFDTVESARVAFLGRRSNIWLQTYYVSLHLTDGLTYPLFYPAYFDGRSSETVANDRLDRLNTYLGKSS